MWHRIVNWVSPPGKECVTRCVATDVSSTSRSGPDQMKKCHNSHVIAKLDHPRQTVFIVLVDHSCSWLVAGKIRQIIVWYF